MRIENDVANELLKDVKKGKRLQEFMDVVSGVDSYRLDSSKRQGYIRNSFAKELISEQFLIELEEIVSVFWQGVFEHLDKAKLYGEVVQIKTPGSNLELRPTNNNPINYLRYHGRMAVRNHISYLYRKNLEQGCPSCGVISTVRANKVCPSCGSDMITAYKFYDILDKQSDLLIDSPCKEVENKETTIKIIELLHEFAEKELKQGTRAYQLLKILTDPAESTGMCNKCDLCDAKIFDIDSCTNYNANIGNWLGVNKTMIASKVRRIRNALPRWLKKHNSDEATYVLEILPTKFKALL
ncbi:hypothetical protein LCGC14_1328940 [marine sediment metagenome]|uniref:Uncharacterized protein n=1 Tax=marine sediment metagenome TaxID=412755 RepID=A0A0F9KHU6_9ZZZZ